MPDEPMGFHDAVLKGREDHSKRARRSHNPWLELAIGWDRGWTDRQRAQLKAAGEYDKIRQMRSFAEMLGDRTERTGV